MSKSVSSFPLCWPEGWNRTPTHKRKRALFSRSERQVGQSWARKRYLTVAEAVGRVRLEISHLVLTSGDLIISTNIPTRLDGLPYSDRKEPTDPGVAVYWRVRRGRQNKCMAIDRYDRVADNLAAVAATVAAMRAIERHGGAEILDRAFTGFTALPAPGGSWWEILGLAREVSLDEAEARYRELAKMYHPDAGGNAHQFVAITNAIHQARKEARAG